jgi:hypothetical protein
MKHLLALRGIHGIADQLELVLLDVPFELLDSRAEANLLTRKITSVTLHCGKSPLGKRGLAF